MSLEKPGREKTDVYASERIRELFGNEAPDAVVVLSADIVEAPEKESGYKSGSYEDMDVRNLLSGAKARVIAGAEASKHFPDAIIVTDTRDRDTSRGRPTHAQIYANELLQLGVQSDRILQEPDSINTITELAEIIKIAAERRWKHIALISNDYHLPRIQEMYARLPELVSADDRQFSDAYRDFTAAGGVISTVSAEDVLLVRDPRYKRLIDTVHALPSYTARVQAEQQGIEDLRQGRYRREI